MKNLKGWIIGLIVLIILMIPIISDYYKSKDIDIINYNTFTSSIQDTEFSLFYLGDTQSDEYSNIKETLLTLRNDFEIPIKTLDSKKLTKNQKADLKELNPALEFDNGYVFVKDSKIVHATKEDISGDELEVLINKYYNNIIPKDEIAYKVAEDYKAFKKVVDSKKVTMFVFGRASCNWCNLYKPVYNDFANEYKLDIYEFDAENYDSKEYSKVLNSGLKIPASCTESNKEQLLSESFSTPLTLFTKNGKVIDCLIGYKDADALKAKLKDVGMIK